MCTLEILIKLAETYQNAVIKYYESNPKEVDAKRLIVTADLLTKIKFNLKSIFKLNISNDTILANGLLWRSVLTDTLLLLFSCTSNNDLLLAYIDAEDINFARFLKKFLPLRNKLAEDIGINDTNKPVDIDTAVNNRFSHLLSPRDKTKFMSNKEIIDAHGLNMEPNAIKFETFAQELIDNKIQFAEILYQYYRLFSQYEHYSFSGRAYLPWGVGDKLNDILPMDVLLLITSVATLCFFGVMY